ncbi:MAG: hypothetical protein WAV38_26830, partial [Xanthobacteraceae bacterium]
AFGWRSIGSPKDRSADYGSIIVNLAAIRRASSDEKEIYRPWWLCAALTGPATFLAIWIYCAVSYGFLFGFLLGWIPALILALVVAVATIYFWPLAAVALL